MRLKPGFFTLLLAGLLSACGADKPLATVDQVDLQRYSGTWYEIARLPQWFQRGCYDSTATYSLNEDGTVRVVNRCQREGKEPSEAQGTARVVPGSDNANSRADARAHLLQ
ncbi:MAG: lipocalin family protein [Alcanivorax sp.]